MLVHLRFYSVLKLRLILSISVPSLSHSFLLLFSLSLIFSLPFSFPLSHPPLHLQYFNTTARPVNRSALIPCLSFSSNKNNSLTNSWKPALCPHPLPLLNARRHPRPSEALFSLRDEERNLHAPSRKNSQNLSARIPQRACVGQCPSRPSVGSSDPSARRRSRRSADEPRTQGERSNRQKHAAALLSRNSSGKNVRTQTFAIHINLEVFAFEQTCSLSKCPSRSKGGGGHIRKKRDFKFSTFCFPRLPSLRFCPSHHFYKYDNVLLCDDKMEKKWRILQKLCLEKGWKYLPLNQLLFFSC